MVHPCGVRNVLKQIAPDNEQAPTACKTSIMNFMSKKRTRYPEGIALGFRAGSGLTERSWVKLDLSDAGE
jgi:hypothetical protein